MIYLLWLVSRYVAVQLVIIVPQEQRETEREREIKRCGFCAVNINGLRVNSEACAEKCEVDISTRLLLITLKSSLG